MVQIHVRPPVAQLPERVKLLKKPWTESAGQAENSRVVPI